jgi:hypothetical protein
LKTESYEKIDYIKQTDAQLKITFYCSFYKMFVPLHMFQTLVHRQGVWGVLHGVNNVKFMKKFLIKMLLSSQGKNYQV